MIRNDNQLTATQRKLQEAQALAESGDELGTSVYGQFASVLEAEIKDYLAVRDGYSQVFKTHDLDHIGEALVRCRISRGWTQRELADALGLKEQQIQRYESTDYQKAALWRVAEVLDALDYTVESILAPRTEAARGANVRSYLEGSSVAQLEPVISSNTVFPQLARAQ